VLVVKSNNVRSRRDDRYFPFCFLPIRLFEERSEKTIREIRLFNSHPCMRRCYFFARLMSAEVVDDVRVCLSISILFGSVPVIYFMCVFLLCVSFLLVSISSRLVTLRIYVYFFNNR